MDRYGMPARHLPRFEDRSEAGRRLAARLLPYRDERPIVLALPRGGVPVGYEIARALAAPLDVWLVRKLGVPGHRELAMGAIALGGTVYIDESTVQALGITRDAIDEVVAEESRELERRRRTFRDARPLPALQDRTVILVDDGLATGSTARAAIQALRQYGPRRLVLAVPVCAQDSAAALRADADDIVCLTTPRDFLAVGWWYRQFEETSDQEVVDLLRRASWEWQAGQDAGEPRDAAGIGHGAMNEPAQTCEVAIPAGSVSLAGTLALPREPRGVVLFAHGSGSGRHSPRNQYVARVLQRRGLATLLFDLLTGEEEAVDARTAQLRFDIGLLAGRLVAATDWAAADGRTSGLRLGYFGASTGGAAALVAAAERPERAVSIVSRGGRPDLAATALPRVQAPTLLIVGGNDPTVLELNRKAYEQMRCERRIEIVPEATHLFEEPGALEAVAELAAAWFTDSFAPSAAASRSSGTRA